MNYATYPKPLLGPCPCRACGKPLYWARRSTRLHGVLMAYRNGYLGWRDWTGRLHKCPKATRRAA